MTNRKIYIKKNSFLIKTEYKHCKIEEVVRETYARQVKQIFKQEYNINIEGNYLAIIREKRFVTINIQLAIGFIVIIKTG